MGGTNPFLPPPKIKLPTQPYSLTFVPGGKRIEVDPKKLPYSRDGLKGSILEIALGNGVEIDHACGGVSACSTCHIIVREGFDSCPEASEDELDQLDNAPGVKPNSRLACQCVPDGSVPIVVEIPDWNRNHAKEAPH